MNIIYNKILSDWTAALRARDSARLNVLGNMKAALLNKAIETGERKTGLNDTQTIGVLSKMQKQCEDAISSLPVGLPLRLKEEFEFAVINTYLPQKISGEELKSAVFDLMRSSGSMDLSSGMKACLAPLKGKVDGREVQQLVLLFIKESKND
jgi:uncharacterized protein YqeY